MRFITGGAAALVLVGLGSSLADAGVTATAQQVGSNVVFTSSGTFDLSGLQFFSNSLTQAARLKPTAAVTFQAGLGPASGYFTSGTPLPQFNGPTSFGTGGLVTADSTTGAVNGFGLDVTYPTSGAGVIVIPTGYVSGSPLASTATYNNKTITTLGITPGVYTWTFPTATGTDFYRIVVPEPTSLSLIALAGAVLGRRRSR